VLLAILVTIVWLGACHQVESAMSESLCPTFTAEGPRTLQGVIRVYADEEFYKAHPEPEENLSGVLEEHQQVLGPTTRPLPFRLVREQEELLVYAVDDTEDMLQTFVGKCIDICGKRVDLRKEGFNVELWIGAIREAHSC
jgi:hypothetical protein